jgi:nucleoside-diphosphate-sugar epimerase
MLPEADLEHVLANTPDLWEPLRGANVFITGGTGFFGRWIVESFLYANTHHDLGATVTILTRNAGAFAEKAPELIRHPALQLVQGDVRELDYDSVAAELPRRHSGEFKFMIHAAMDSVGQENPVSTFETILTGTRAALEFAVDAGTERFLFTSSGAVYGPQLSDVTHVPETYMGAPDCLLTGSAYGEGKRAAELLCAAYYARDPALQPIIARCFAFVGPLLPIDAHFAIGNFIRDALNGQTIAIGGDGTPYRSYLYAADLAIWLWTLLIRGQPLRAYNVGSESDVTILELASMVAECFSNRSNVTVASQPQPGAQPARYVPATSRATDELGLTALIPIKEAILRTAAWHFIRNPSLAQPLGAAS